MQMALTALNLEYSVQEFDGMADDYGKRLPNGTYDSYLYWLQQDYADLIVGSFAMTEQRQRDFDMLNTEM
jgi:hypothetical protein